MLLPDDLGRRSSPPFVASRAPLVGPRTALAAASAPTIAREPTAAQAAAHAPGGEAAAAISPFFEEFAPRRPAPATVADAPPPVADEGRLLTAVKEALPILGGTADAGWGRPTAVGPVLQVRWQPGVALREADEVRDAVVAAVETVVRAMDRTFPEGFRSDQGTPLAAVQVGLPEHDPVLVAVRTYRELVAGETSLAQVPGQWRLLSRAAAPAPRPAPRLVPDRPTEGAPQRWPPNVARWYPEVLHAAQKYEIDPDLLAAIMQQESGGRAEAVGAWAWIPHMGRYERAIGMMQVMPNEAQRRGVDIEEAWEPQANILLGARVLRDKLTVIRGDFWTRVQGYYGFGDALSEYWLNRVYANWLAFRDPPDAR
jgi:soluble lytic murein transglycosylase-like protein